MKNCLTPTQLSFIGLLVERVCYCSNKPFSKLYIQIIRQVEIKATALKHDVISPLSL